MTGFLLGAVLAVGLVAIAEGYAIFGRMQLFLTAAEQILTALQVPLRDVPSKSAGRTVAAADIRPRPWFQVLRRLAELTQPTPVAEETTGADDLVQDQVDDELGRWADDGGPQPGDDQADDVDDDTPTDVFPAIDPATTPAGLAIDAWQQTDIPARTELEDESWRDRFDFSGGRHQRDDRP